MKSSVKQRTFEFIKHKGITMKRFEDLCGLSNGYVAAMRKSYGTDKLNNVLEAFPDLSRDWLLYGEGEMIKSDSPQQISNGDNNTQVSGNGNQVNGDVTVQRFLDKLDKQMEITREAQQQLTKSQEQIDRLITLIEKLK